MKLLKSLCWGITALALVAVPVAYAAGLFPGFPIVGGASYSMGNNQTVAAGPTILTGNETAPFDTNLTQGATPQTVLVKPGALANYAQAPTALTLSSSTLTPTLNTSLLFTATLSTAAPGTTIAAPTSPTSGQVWHLKLLQDATGGRTVTWNSTYKWPAGTAPTLTATASKADIFKCVYDGAAHFCSTTGLNYTP